MSNTNCISCNKNLIRESYTYFILNRFGTGHNQECKSYQKRKCYNCKSYSCSDCLKTCNYCDYEFCLNCSTTNEYNINLDGTCKNCSLQYNENTIKYCLHCEESIYTKTNEMCEICECYCKDEYINIDCCNMKLCLDCLNENKFYNKNNQKIIKCLSCNELYNIDDNNILDPDFIYECSKDCKFIGTFKDVSSHENKCIKI